MADCFIKLDQVNGESGDADYKSYIQVDSWEWSIGHPERSGWEAKTSRKVQLSNLVFTHTVDTASPSLWTRCARNEVVPTAALVMRRAGGTAQKYLTITLKRVRIVHATLLHDATHVVPRERVTLAFEEVAYEYTPQSSTGAAKSGASVFQMNLIEPT